ncbi:probable cytochrome P450 4d14 [Wyeomyia smithii]|uniref:probable cytochrome P450 4d14 n=1 Tax=Wyeomyia smithii TaxID=174621 RepID=UPI002467F31F|nr:probable cytochrome P450 4d14 [Wyeomyia smithii]
MFYIVIFVALVTIIISRFLHQRRKLLRFTSHFKGPIPNVLLGNLKEFETDVPGIFKRMVELHVENGPDIVTWGVGNDIMLNVTSASSVEKVLMAKSTEKSTIYDLIEPWLGKGLLISSGEKWFNRRKIITPTFHFKILEGFTEVFNREADVLMQKLRKHDSAEEFNVYNYISLYALDSICETSMGVRINAQEDPNNQYVCDVKRMSELVLLRIFSPISFFPTVYWYVVPKAWEQRKLIRRLHQFTDSVIHQRREQLQKERQLGEIAFDLNETDMYSKRKQTFLDLLLNVTVDGKPLSDLDIREEVDTFMFEGHDTTTSGIAFTIMQLAKHQDIQQKVYDEVVSILGKSNCKNAQLTYNSLQNFSYLDLVIKESLRLLPPVSFIGRRLVEDTEINGVIVPAGVDVTVPIYVIHRNPEVYPDPERFDPERFADSTVHRRGPYDYIPFSIGSRNCIGQRYALMELKITIIRLVANFQILPGATMKDIRFKTDLVLRPDGGIPIRVVERW